MSDHNKSIPQIFFCPSAPVIVSAGSWYASVEIGTQLFYLADDAREHAKN